MYADDDHHRHHHVEGMLDRDQRTARTAGAAAGRRRGGGAAAAAAVAPPTAARAANRRCPATRIPPSLPAGLLLVGACLSLAEAAAAAPTTMHGRWVTPCGVKPYHDPSSRPVDVLGMFGESIAGQADGCRTTARAVRVEYAKVEMNTDEKLQAAQLQALNYSWLPDFGKRLGGKVDPEQITSRSVDDNLLFMYTSLQKIAVGVEQMIWDQEAADKSGPFNDLFKQTYERLISVLCEILMALPAPVENNITRAHMPEADRGGDRTERQRRDFIVLRECENAMEYVLQVLALLRQ